MAFRGTLVKKSADQTGANYSGSGVVVAWDSEIYDTDGAHDNVTNNTRLTIPAAWNGAYGRLYSTISFDLVTTSSLLILEFMKGSVPSNAFVGTARSAWAHDGKTGALTAEGWINVVGPPILLVTGDIYGVRYFNSDTSTTVKAESNFGIHVLDLPANNMGALIQKSGDQIGYNAAVALTAIAWDGVDVYDTHNLHNPASNNTKIIVPAALNGKKAIIGAQIFVENHTSGLQTIAITKNGSSTYDGVAGASGRRGGASNQGAIQCFTAPITLATGDQFETIYYANDTSLDIIAAKSSMSLRVVE